MLWLWPKKAKWRYDLSQTYLDFGTSIEVVSKLIPEPIDSVLPHSDLEHSAEQLWVVGDDPSDMDDQLLLQNSLALPTGRAALAVDDALDHPRWQWVGDHLFFMTKHTQGHLTHTHIYIHRGRSIQLTQEQFELLSLIYISFCECVHRHVYKCAHTWTCMCTQHSKSSMVQFLEYLCSITLKLASFQRLT